MAGVDRKTRPFLEYLTFPVRREEYFESFYELLEKQERGEELTGSELDDMEDLATELGIEKESTLGQADDGIGEEEGKDEVPAHLPI